MDFMKSVGAQSLFSYAVFFLCLSVVLFARAGEWWEAPNWRPTSSDEKVFVQDYPGNHQFLEACRQGRVDIVEYWVNQEGFRPNDEFISRLAGYKVSGLFVASHAGRNHVVKLLVEVGADLNQTWNGATPLFIASQMGHIGVVQILVGAGANLNQARQGATPLFQASQNGHVDVVKILLSAGADLNLTWHGVTPLYQASDRGHADVVQILVEAGDDNLNLADAEGATPLFMASQNGHAEVVKILVKNGANPFKKWHHNVFFTKSPLTAAQQDQPFRLRDSEARARYASIIQTLKTSIKVWKEQKKIQAKIDSNTGCFDGFVCALKESIKHTAAPLMIRAPLKSKGY